MRRLSTSFLTRASSAPFALPSQLEPAVSHPKSASLFARFASIGALVCLSTLGTACPDPVEPTPEPAPQEPEGTPEPSVEPDAEPSGLPDGGPIVDGGPIADGGPNIGDGGPNIDDGGPTGSDAGVDAGPVDAGPPPNVCVAAGDAPSFQISQKAKVRWKRDRVVERDLMNAFALAQNEVCAELGSPICFSSIHRVPLGGHEPVVQAMYEGIAAPGATTPISFDRVVLSACGARVDLDTLAHLGDGGGGFGAAELYRHYRLDAESLSSTSPEVAAQITDLYRRVLARDPTDNEVAQVASLADAADGDTPNARDFSKMACYAITSTTEFLFQ